MRADTHPGDLPSERRRSTVLSDVSSYNEVAAAGYAVYSECGKKRRTVGWARVGESLPFNPVSPFHFPLFVPGKKRRGRFLKKYQECAKTIPRKKRAIHYQFSFTSFFIEIQNTDAGFWGDQATKEA